MFARLIYESFRRQKRRKLLAGVSVLLGVSVATAMIAVATNIGDKINAELRTYGANIVVYPDTQGLDVEIGGVDLKPVADTAYLNEAELPKIKGMFWKNNIVGFAPMLPVRVQVRGQEVELVGTYFAKSLRYDNEQFTTGVRATNPWWHVTGAWPRDDSHEVLIGEQLARGLALRPGDQFPIVGHDIIVSGILSTGSAEDRQIVAPLSLAQKIASRPGAVAKIYVSALTKPEDALARRDPKTLSPEMFDRWYCSPYVSSIAYQLQEAIPHSRAEQIRQVAQNEGNVLSRIKGLMLLITLAALLASALAVSAAMATAILERRGEVGLMKALGAHNTTIATLFFTESALLAVAAGTAGFAAGSFLAHQIGLWIFDSRILVQPVLLPIVLGIAVLVTFLGSAASVRKAMHLDPARVLRGDA